MIRAAGALNADVRYPLRNTHTQRAERQAAPLLYRLNDGTRNKPPSVVLAIVEMAVPVIPLHRMPARLTQWHC